MALPNSEKITSQLASMPDQALKQMAMMHKADPYILPLIISEDGRRKQLRSAAMARMAAPQPKVADAAVQQMGAADAMGNVTGYAAGGMPEDQGIARLKTPNIAHMADGGIAGYGGSEFDFAQKSEPVVRMAGGGVPGYKKGGLTEKQEFAMQYKDLAEKVGAELGVDPGIIIAQWGMETGWGKKTVGQYNFGNIKDVTGKGPRAYDKKEKSRDSYKSYDSPDAFAADYAALIKRNFPDAVGAGSDIGAFSSGLQSGKKGAYATDPNYEKVLANTFKNLPIGSAQAGEQPKAEGKKPGLENARDTAKATGTAGLTGLMAPGAVVSAVDAGNSLFQKFGHQPANIGPMQPPQALTTAQKLGRFFGAAAVPQTVLAGGMAASDKAMSDLQYMSPEQRREMSSNPMLSAMSGDAGLAAAIMDAAANNPKGPSQMPYKEQMTNVAKALVQHPDATKMRDTRKAKEEAEAVPKQLGMVPVSPDEFGSAVGIPEPVKEKVVEAAKSVVPEKKSSGISNDDYLMMGLNLLANKSSNFVRALGESGVATLGAKREREKAATDTALKEAQTRQTAAYADYLERGGKEKNKEFEAEKEVNDYMEKWDKNNKIVSIQDPTARMREEQRIRQQIYASLGLKPIMAQQAAPTDSGGFKFVGVS